MKSADQKRVVEVIKNCTGKMSQRDIAGLLGISRTTVQNYQKKLGLSARSPTIPTMKDTNPNADRLSRLEELRDMLYEQMQQTGGGTLAALSKEYRATLGEIEGLGEGGDGSEDDDPLARLMEKYGDG